MFSLEEAEFEDSVVASPISLAKVSEVVKKFRSSNPAGVDEIRHEMLKALDIIGLFWLTYLLSVMCRSGIVPVEWQIRVWRRVCFSYRVISGYYTTQSPQEFFFQSAGKEAPTDY